MLCPGVLVWLVVLFMVVVMLDRRLPSPLTMADKATHQDSFIEERARLTLKALTSIGPRPAGSYENEVLAVAFIKKELSSIKERANPVHKLSIDIQVIHNTHYILHKTHYTLHNKQQTTDI